jgi:hypothetical protein
MTRWLIIAAALIGLTLLLLYPLARPRGAGASRAPSSELYQNWINQADKGCCNNQDCGELAGDNERTVAGRIEVRIEGTWCPVLAHHYLKKGNAPDWSTSHVCVRKNYEGLDTPTCERLLCYQPKPGT